MSATASSAIPKDGGPAISASEWNQACALILAARRVVLTTHAGPDGDGIGSMVGLSIALRALDKTVAMVCADPVPPDLAFVPHADEIQVLPQLAALPFAPDLIIVCDSASLERLGAVYVESQPCFAALPILNLDHHQTNTRFGQANLVDTTAAATAEIAHELLERLHVEPTPEVATALMVGLGYGYLGVPYG